MDARVSAQSYALLAMNIASGMFERTVGTHKTNRVRSWGYTKRTGIPRELNIPRGSTVVQVGMWRTGNAMRLARAIGPTGRGLLVEASAEHSAQIREEFRREGFDHMTVVSAAGWSENTELDLFESDEPSGHQVEGVGLDMPKSFTGGKNLVRAVRIDDLASEHGITHADYVELTVNGAEIQVLEGMPHLLENTNRLLVAGMMRDSEGKPAHSEVEPYLNARGFETTISKQGHVVSEEWGQVDGHVFAYRP